MTWFVVILVSLAVCAIALLLFIELMGNDGLRFYKLKHKRGKYVNDQTAVICQTIKDTNDDRKAYIIFVEYMFTNHKQFLSFVRNQVAIIEDAFHNSDVSKLHQVVNDVREMKVELKDQNITQDDCMNSIDTTTYIEASAWIHLANNCRFGINEGIKRIAECCIEHLSCHSEPFLKRYDDLLDFLNSDLQNICTSIYDLIGSGDIEGMRELRKSMSVILSESYSNTQRLYELLHDGRSSLQPETRVSLQYVLNVFQEFHCMIYTLRRLVLCELCLTLSINNA